MTSGLMTREYCAGVQSVYRSLRTQRDAIANRASAQVWSATAEFPPHREITQGELELLDNLISYIETAWESHLLAEHD
jgi:hypothetical protein